MPGLGKTPTPPTADAARNPGWLSWPPRTSIYAVFQQQRCAVGITCAGLSSPAGSKQRAMRASICARFSSRLNCTHMLLSFSTPHHARR